MNESRIEKKFVLGKYKEDFLTRFLLINGFTNEGSWTSHTGVGNKIELYKSLIF